MLIQALRSSIYYVTSDMGRNQHQVRRAVAAVLRAGVGMVQLRAKSLSRRDLIEEASALVRMTRAAKVPLIIDDCVDVALAVGADGVHLGAEDLPVAYARRLMGPTAIIGATTPTPEDARIAQADGATYVAVGAIYPSPTRPEKPVLGLEALEAVRAATTLPVCAIGGVGPEHLEEVVAHGAELLAVISAISDQPDPEAAARELVRHAARIKRPGHIGV